MAEEAEKEGNKLDQILESIDLLFTRVTDIGLTQQRMRTQLELTTQAVDLQTAEQKLTARQIAETGQVVAQMRLNQRTRPSSPSSDSDSIPSEEVDNHQHEELHGERTRGPVPRHVLPKMSCPRFNGENPVIWRDKCMDYFQLFDVPQHLWVRVASLNFDEPAAQWLQVYKKKNKSNSWLQFVLAVEQKFGKDNYRRAVTELLELQQTGTVEEYYQAFQTLQFEVCMYNSEYGEVFFTSQFINGLKEEIRYPVQAQVPADVDRAYLLAKIQQKICDRSRGKGLRSAISTKPGSSAVKAEPKHQQPTSNLWKERQLRDYRKANGLCYLCGDKYDPTHVEVCPKRQKAQLNTLALNDLDANITEDILNQLEMEDALADTFCQLSLHAMAGTEDNGCIKLKSLVKNKSMIMLLDSGSSHSFVNASFVAAAGLHTVPTTPKMVQLAIGQQLLTDKMVPKMEWWCQGHTLSMDMRVLELGAYDAILGYDWLQTHSPMSCHWENRTIQFQGAKTVTLQGLPPAPVAIEPITARQLWKSCKANDIWAFAIVTTAAEPPKQSPPDHFQWLLQQYQDIFSDPKTLPPQRAYDHAISLQPGAVPINCRPYKYSPQHKTEIEKQVKELLEAGLITHSTSPFASPVLLVQKKDGGWRFCVDYRHLNAMTIKNRFPMPIIEEILDELAGSRYFTKLDMKSGYHQVRMLAEDEYKTAFKTHQGHYQFKVMPFGLTNAPSTFQCIMNEILKPFLRKFVLVFLDDILIYSPTLEAHEHHVQQVFELLRTHQFFLKASKCSFAQHSLEY